MAYANTARRRGVWRLLLLLCAIAVLQTATATRGAAACNCNNGLVLHTQPSCSCLCFDKYLLPSCLYRADDMVPVELIFRPTPRSSSPSSTSSSSSSHDGGVGGCYFSAGEVVRLLAWAFDSDVSQFTYEYGYDAHTATAAPTTAASPPTPAGVGVRAVVTMPGWTAQHLHADVLQNNRQHYVLPVVAAMATTTATTTATTATTTVAPCYALAAVRVVQSSPLQQRSYTDVWLRMYAGNLHWSRAWYLAVDTLAWLAAAVVLTLGLLILEQWTLYNMDYNVGGGVVQVWMSTRNVVPSRGLGSLVAAGGDRLSHARASMRGTFTRLLRHDGHPTTAATATAAGDTSPSFMSSSRPPPRRPAAPLRNERVDHTRQRPPPPPRPSNEARPPRRGNTPVHVV